MKRIREIALAAVVFLVVGGFFGLVPLGNTPGTTSYHGPNVTCNLPLGIKYQPPYTTREGIPIPYITYNGTCAPPSPSSGLIPFIVDIVFGGIVGLVAAKVLLRRIKS